MHMPASPPLKLLPRALPWRRRAGLQEAAIGRGAAATARPALHSAIAASRIMHTKKARSIIGDGFECLSTFRVGVTMRIYIYHRLRHGAARIIFANTSTSRRRFASAGR